MPYTICAYLLIDEAALKNLGEVREMGIRLRRLLFISDCWQAQDTGFASKEGRASQYAHHWERTGDKAVHANASSRFENEIA